MKINFLSITLLAILMFTSCSDRDDGVVVLPEEEMETYTFRVTLKNTMNFWSIQ